MWILDLVPLAGAVLMVILLLLLRALLSMPFPQRRARVVSGPLPASVVDLYREAGRDLVALGFQEPTQLMFDHIPEWAGQMRHAVVWRHFEHGALVWLFPPMDIQRPNHLLVVWTTTLRDGRVVTSQAFDPYFSLFAASWRPVQTIHGADLKTQFKEHQGFRAGFPPAADLQSLDTGRIVELAGEGSNRERAELLDKGLLTLDRDGVARLSWRRALPVVWVFLRRKLPKDPRRPIPAERLALLSRVVERVRERAPTLPVQLALFGVSLLLSVVVGALVWDLQVALLLLLVIIIHEGGHYLAMRAFGYRNVHMMALPLVGGVTMGVDASPDAARRAWMSLMGPLPGILIGWGLGFAGWGAGIRRVGDGGWKRQGVALRRGSRLSPGQLP